MIIIVDGYNVLKQIGKKETITETERRSFVNKLGLYKKKRNHKKIMVVFDAGPSTWVSQEKIRGVVVVYSGSSKTADDYIESYIEENKQKAESMMLITSDRALASFASEHGIASVDSLEFYKIVMNVIRPPVLCQTGGQQVVKMTRETNIDLDELMHKASKGIISKAEDGPEGVDKIAKARGSKRERALLKKFSKL